MANDSEGIYGKTQEYMQNMCKIDAQYAKIICKKYICRKYANKYATSATSMQNISTKMQKKYAQYAKYTQKIFKLYPRYVQKYAKIFII